MRVYMILLVAFFTLACGDDDGGSDTGTSDTGTSDTGTSDTSTSDTGTSDAGSDTGGDDAGDDAGEDAGLDTGADAGGDAGSTEVVITIDDAQAWANCMPIVPADPLRFFLDLAYDNTGGASAATATITSATLTFDDADGSIAMIDFDVAEVNIPAGGTIMQRHAKTTSAPVVPSCAICSEDRMLTYDVVVEVDGVVVPQTGTINFGCTF